MQRTTLPYIFIQNYEENVGAKYVRKLLFHLELALSVLHLCVDLQVVITSQVSVLNFNLKLLESSQVHTFLDSSTTVHKHRQKTI